MSYEVRSSFAGCASSQARRPAGETGRTDDGDADATAVYAHGFSAAALRPAICPNTMLSPLLPAP
jgi:hypothetical protein